MTKSTILALLEDMEAKAKQREAQAILDRVDIRAMRGMIEEAQMMAGLLMPPADRKLN